MLESAIRKLRARLFKAQIERELDEEIRFHLEMEAQANRAAGMAPADAQRAAVMGLGGVSQTHEQVRDVYATALDSLAQDARYALRTFRRSKGLTAAAVVTLAVGIFAATSIYSVVDAVLVRRLPYPESDRLVRIMGWYPETAAYQEAVSRDELLAYRTARAFDAVTTFTPIASPLALSTSGGVQVVRSASVAPGFLAALGAHVLHGRDFRPDRAMSEGGGEVILTFGAWQRLFGGDLQAIGRPITLDQRPHAIIGILPADFRYPSLRSSYSPDVLTPDGGAWESADPRDRFFLLARLKPTTSLGAAQAEIDAIAGRKRATRDRPQSARLLPLQDHLSMRVRTSLLLLFGSALCLLLIGCLNVSNLLLAKGFARRQEVGIRVALGADRGRLARQRFVESGLLSLAGGIVGVLLSVWMLPPVLAQCPPSLRLGVNDIAINGRVLALSLLAMTISTVIHGLWPAWTAWDFDVLDALKMRGGPVLRRFRPGRFEPALMVAEAALAMVLLVSGGLLLNTLVRLNAVSLGYPTKNLCRIGFYLDPRTYASSSEVLNFHKDLRHRIGSIPGVVGVAAVDYPPLFGGGGIGAPVRVTGSPDIQRLDLRHVSADYFSVIGIRLVAGRFFTPSEERAVPDVALINERMARRYWPGKNPLGETLVVDGKRTVQIIGVVGDVRENEPLAGPGPSVYVPLGDPTYSGLRSLTIVVRTATDQAAVYRAVATTAQAADVQQVVELEMYRDLFAFRTERFYAILLGLCSVFGIVLVSIGIAGTTAYGVAQRRFEIGVRLAVGARPGQVVRQVMRRSVLAAGGGLVIGAAASVLVTRLFDSLLYEITPADPFTLVAATATFLAVAVLAAYIPARRVTRVDPLTALRNG